MLSKRPTWIRFTVPVGLFVLVLLAETALINLFPTVKEFYNLLLLTALGGSFAMSLFLPHPRQERKRREALALLLKAKENTVPAANATTGLFIPKESEETLAEKRP